MSDITVTTTEGGVTVVTDTLGAAAAAAAAVVSAAAAATSASNASTSASNAASSASAASTSASTATTQAGNASTSASAAASSASAAAGSASAASTSAGNAASSASAASTSASNASTSASAASTSASNASSSASAAASSAASAAASAVTEIGAGTNTAAFAAVTLAAIDRTVFAATIVDTFLYDTEKDSDGGAWRKRCAHTSWENETLSGNWLGSAANETAARAISGATTGSYYYDTTALGFYTLNAGSGKTVTYRGNVRQFPAQVLITVEAARVVLWDLTQAGAPMWMVFPQGSFYFLRAYTISSVAALNGQLLVGQATVGCAAAMFISDTTIIRDSGGTYTKPQNIAARATANGTYNQIGSALVNGSVNDVAMTVLPNAPVDVATGLPIPVIDVFTDAGTSRINTDGTVADLADTAGDDHKAGCILASGDSVGLNSTNGNVDIYKLSNTLADTLTPDRTYDQVTVPALLEAVDAGDKVVAIKHRLAIGQDNGVNVLLENPSSVAAGMIAYMTKDYNSGWQVGAIKGAWLADTVAETLTGAELVTNGTFATDTTGWMAVNSSLASVSGELQVTNSGANFGYGYQAITTVVGKTYVASCLARQSTSANVYFKVGISAADATKGIATTASGTNVPLSVSFVATSTTTYLTGQNNNASGGIGYFDNITCRLADVDRSVKAKGLQAFGSLTKAAVASGAALMGYSGFSAANYLEQPYNSDLDFGTGDFCIMGWLTEAPNSAIEYLFNRDSATPGKAIRLWVSVAGYLVFELYDGTTTRTATGTVAVDTSTRLFWLATYSAGTLTIYVNGVSYATATGTALLTLTNASAVTRIGLDVAGSYPATNANLVLVRAGATVPSAEQIKHIYETERPMFEANASCVLAGTSNAVTALAYDDETDLLHVGTSYGRSAFKGLVRVASEATPVGAITALAASAGVVVQGGASGVDVYVPAYTLREELLRDAEQMAKFGQNLIAHDFTATSSQEVFTLPVGWEIVAVYQQGTLKRETTAWVRTFDGFKWSVDLVTGATVSDWISILAKRV